MTKVFGENADNYLVRGVNGTGRGRNRMPLWEGTRALELAPGNG